MRRKSTKCETPYPGAPDGMVALYYHDPFSFHRLYGEEKYDLCGMIVAETDGFPHYVEPDSVFSVYDDRIYGEWRTAWDGIQSTKTGDAWLNGVSNADLLKAGSAIAEVCGFSKPLTGVRIVRYTNLSSGYPCYLLIGTHSGTRSAASESYGRDACVMFRRMDGFYT